MKMRNALMMIVTGLAIASTGQTKTGPKLGTIIVYRPWSILGSAITNWRFNVNHGPDLIVRNGTYYRVTVLAGDSIISHDNMPFIEEDPQRVHVEPGQTVYFQYMSSWGLIFEEADDQERAARTASQLEPVN